MTQATLENRKTATRRVIKPKYSNTHFMFRTDKYGTEFVEMQNQVEGETWGKNEDGTTWHKILGYIVPKAPYKVGDILYVQETWQIHDLSPEFCMMIRFKADNHCELQVEFKPSRFDKFEKFYYKNGWQSPYFMPKEAARLFLKVTDVRVERLQDISNQEAHKEGVKATGSDVYCGHGTASSQWDFSVEKFTTLWDSTIKKQDLDKYGWEANPWVWVIEFERVEVQQ